MGAYVVHWVVFISLNPELPFAQAQLKQLLFHLGTDTENFVTYNALSQIILKCVKNHLKNCDIMYFFVQK